MGFVKRHTSLLCLVGVLAVTLALAGLVRRRQRPAPRNYELTDATVVRASENYRRQEGDKRRGRAFADLAMQMTQRHAAGRIYIRADFLGHLGPPDLCAGSAAGGQAFAYFYVDAGEAAGSVLITIAPDGRATHFGWNDRAANDFSPPAWAPFDGR
jgi:hypothetical protein